MKLAVLLFGHLRTYEKCYKKLKEHLLDLYDCDVFMHTWSTTEAGVSWQNHNGSSQRAKNKSSYEVKEKLIEIYNLKDILIEEQESKDFGSIVACGGVRPIRATQCMLHSMDSVRKIKDKWADENKVNYDYVLFIRPDVGLKNDFVIEDYIKDLSVSDIQNSFFAAHLKLDIPRVNDLNFVCMSDVLFFAKDNVIKNIFQRKEEFLTKFVPGLEINYPPEGLFNNFVEELNHKFYAINFVAHRDFNIVRSNNGAINSLVAEFFKLHLRFAILNILPYVVANKPMQKFKEKYKR